VVLGWGKEPEKKYKSMQRTEYSGEENGRERKRGKEEGGERSCPSRGVGSKQRLRGKGEGAEVPGEEREGGG
jgi:hypothetical protein